jgi:hypothetical protein
MNGAVDINREAFACLSLIHCALSSHFASHVFRDDFNRMAYLRLPVYRFTGIPVPADLLSRRESNADYPAELFVLVVKVCCDDDGDFSWLLHAADSDLVGVKDRRAKVLMRQALSGKLSAFLPCC